MLPGYLLLRLIISVVFVSWLSKIKLWKLDIENFSSESCVTIGSRFGMMSHLVLQYFNNSEIGWLLKMDLIQFNSGWLVLKFGKP